MTDLVYHLSTCHVILGFIFLPPTDTWTDNTVMDSYLHNNLHNFKCYVLSSVVFYRLPCVLFALIRTLFFFNSANEPSSGKKGLNAAP